MKKKILLAFLVCGLVLTTGCGKKEEVSNNNDKNNTVEKANVEIKNNMFYVNGNKVDFYNVSNLRDEYSNESEFYCSNGEDDNYEPASFEYQILDTVVFVKFKPCRAMGNNLSYFVDENGKIIKRVNGTNADITLSIDNDLISIERAEGATVYLSIKEFTQDPKYTTCDKIANGKGNEIYKYVDKVTHLGNGEFKLEKAVETTTYDQFRNENQYTCE